MQETANSCPFKFDKKPKLMPCIDNFFVIAPPQSASDVISEYKNSEKEPGIIVMYYLTSGVIQLRTCHTYYSKIDPGKFELVAYNHYRERDFRYYGHCIYRIKFIPTTHLDGSPWVQDQRTEFISYFFDLGKATKSPLDRTLHSEKIARALNGQRLITSRKKISRGRVARWLVNNGLWIS